VNKIAPPYDTKLDAVHRRKVLLVIVTSAIKKRRQNNRESKENNFAESRIKRKVIDL